MPPPGDTANAIPTAVQVEVSINLDGTGRAANDTPVHFLNHMLDVRLVLLFLWGLVLASCVPE